MTSGAYTSGAAHNRAVAAKLKGKQGKGNRNSFSDDRSRESRMSNVDAAMAAAAAIKAGARVCMCANELLDS